MPQSANTNSGRFGLITLSTLTILAAGLAWSELQRVAGGDLFLFALPWDPAPTEVQLEDARESAEHNLKPATAVVVVLGLILACTWRTVFDQRQKHLSFESWTVRLFLLSVLADLATTVWFFHGLGIEFEFHPAIRLFGYAYGPTVGPLLGKALQAAGVLYMAVLLKQRGKWLLWTVTAVYSTAALYNASKMI